MNEDLRLKIRSFLQDFLNNKALGALNQEEQFSIGVALNADHLAHGAVAEQVILARLARID